MGFPVARSVAPEGGAPVSLLFEIGANTLLAVDVVASLDPGPLLLEESCKRLERLNAGTVRTSRGSMSLPRDARLARLSVVVIPGHAMVPSSGGVAGATLEDLEWIVQELRETPDDIWWFVRDLAEHPGVRRQVFAWETINVFEHWREMGGRLVPGGVDVDGLLIEPHRGIAELQQAAVRLPYEQALSACDLPAVAAFDHVKIEPPKTGLLMDLSHDLAVHVVPGHPALCVVYSPQQLPPDTGRFISSTAEVITWKAERMAPVALIPEILGREGLSIALRSTSASEHVTCDRVGDGRMYLAIPEVGAERCRDDAEGFEREIGDAIVEGLSLLTGTPEPAIELAAIRSAWAAAPQGIRVDAFRLPQREQTPPDPQAPSGAARMRFERELARQLQSQGIRPGRWTGEKARDFESQHANPTLMAMLRTELDRFAGDALLSIAVRENDLGHARRIRDEIELTFSQRFPVVVGDPAEKTRALVNEAMDRSRVHALLIEEIVSVSPSGSRKPDRVEWRELLALARLCFESGMRSESIHCGLTPTTITVSDRYEITWRADEATGLTDLSKFEAALLGERPIGRGLPWLHEDDARQSDDEGGEYQALLAPVDAALRQDLGFGLWNLLHVLWALRGWPLHDRIGTDWAMEAEIAAFCASQVEGISEGEAAAVIRRLTLTAASLGPRPLEHWEQERRPARLFTHPFVQRSDGRLAVMPWALEATLRIYMRYVGDGRLPWPPSTSPPALTRAMNRYRQDRNAEFERQVHTLLTDTGYLARRNVKKPAAIGLETLSGEIDVIAADPTTATIWVVEAKDPQEAFSARQIKDSVHDFHGAEGKAYVAKLVKKVGDVSVQSASVAAALGAGAAVATWQVRGLMVTRRPVAAAFAATKVPFVTVDQVCEYMKSGAITDARRA
jgi:hypothetical protein